MIGCLKKINNKWVIFSNGEGYLLHPDDVKEFNELDLVFDNLEARINAEPQVIFRIIKDGETYGKLIKNLDDVDDETLIGMFLKEDIEFISWETLMKCVISINNLGKQYQFSIFKTYASCTVEKPSKFHKDFSFTSAEYFTKEQDCFTGVYNLIIKFLLWYYKTKPLSC
jgi:hypothetical protein